MSTKNSSQLSLKSSDSSDASEVSARSEITEDWMNREFIDAITTGIQRITTFLNTFDHSCRVKLASLKQRVTKMEMTVDYLEALFTRDTNVNTISEEKE